MTLGSGLDPRAVFLQGAQWWADTTRQLLAESANENAEKYFPGGDIAAGLYAAHPPEGDWPAGYIGRAFVEGAKWQEYTAEGATMWQSDRRLAEQEAVRRYGEPTP